MGFFGGGAVVKGTATTVDVRANKTFESAQQSGVATGALADNGNGTTITPTTTNQTVVAGIWDTANTVEGDANLVTGNIKSGVSIFGVAGDTNVVDTSAATAAAGDVRTGKTAFVAGAEVTGSLAEVAGGNTVTPTTTAQTAIAAATIADAAIGVAGDSNLLAANIKSGVSIFGVAGTFSGPAVQQSTGSAVAASTAGTFTASVGSSTTLYDLVVPVPSGASKILAVIVTAWLGGGINNIGEVAVFTPTGIETGAGSPSSTGILGGGVLSSTTNANYFRAEAGGNLSLTTTSIVVPVEQASTTYYYTVVYQ